MVSGFAKMVELSSARRGLLRLFGVAAGGAAAGSAQAFNADGERRDIRAEPETEAEKRKPRYRETDHVRDFYRTNRS